MKQRIFKNIRTASASLLAVMSLTAPVVADDDIYFTLTGGVATLDIADSAGKTAQTIADAAGQTVNYEFNQATWLLRLGVGIPVSDNVSVEGGYFISGNIGVKYSLPTVSAEEKYSATGFDITGKYTTDTGLFFKGGAHRSEVTAKGTITIGGTAYNVGSVATSGNGLVFGIGFESDGSIFGFDMYQNVAGLTANDVGYFYYGLKF